MGKYSYNIWTKFLTYGSVDEDAINFEVFRFIENIKFLVSREQNTVFSYSKKNYQFHLKDYNIAKNSFLAEATFKHC